MELIFLSPEAWAETCIHVDELCKQRPTVQRQAETASPIEIPDRGDVDQLIHRNVIGSRQTEDVQAVKSKALLRFKVDLEENENVSLCHFHEVEVITCSTTEDIVPFLD